MHHKFEESLTIWSLKGITNYGRSGNKDSSDTMNSRMIFFRRDYKDSCLVGHDYRLLLPAFTFSFHGDSVRTELGVTLVKYPQQAIKVPGRVVTVFIPLNEKYDSHSILSPSTLVFIHKGNGVPFIIEVVVDSKPFIFWPPLFTTYRICPDRLLAYAVLPDDQRIRYVEEKYPTSKKSIGSSKQINGRNHF